MASTSNSLQRSGTVPSDVVNLYNSKKLVQKSKHYNAPENRKQKKIESFFSRSNDTRTSRFNSNRTNNETNPSQSADNIDIESTELNEVLSQANVLSTEFNSLLQNDEINYMDMFKMMGKMNKIMLDLVLQLKSAMDHKNKVIIGSFTNKLKDCTSFISNEINYVKKEIEKVKKNDEVECLKTTQACSRDLRRIWIRFIYENDAEEARNQNSHAAIKKILTHLSISLNTSQYPLESFYFQSRKFSADQLIPEISLCCIFVNSTLATIVKNGIIKFNKMLEENKQQHLIRYKVSNDWSYNIRQILKPCNEMRRFEIIDRVFITNDGIKVYHREIDSYNQPDKKTSMTLVNSIRKLDMLRKKLNDFNCTVTASETYNGDYFKMSFNDRQLIRTKYKEAPVNFDEEEVMPSDDEFMDASVVEINQ
ncbi:unnamed protein product [Chironomus riparius]|uniref:Uncharacterized protein n=1 Tax=Chironomus riparius TaxID=315576 RepID=A0A9N9S1M9_9DIPT|nr:unnamed protein product [Chironomus riparius]